jgi:hypothetical protein
VRFMRAAIVGLLLASQWALGCGINLILRDKEIEEGCRLSVAIDDGRGRRCNFARDVAKNLEKLKKAEVEGCETYPLPNVAASGGQGPQ